MLYVQVKSNILRGWFWCKTTWTDWYLLLTLRASQTDSESQLKCYFWSCNFRLDFFLFFLQRFVAAKQAKHPMLFVHCHKSLCTLCSETVEALKVAFTPCPKTCVKIRSCILWCTLSRYCWNDWLELSGASSVRKTHQQLGRRWNSLTRLLCIQWNKTRD